jgi:flagellar biosynthesis GTPase FlhF
MKKKMFVVLGMLLATAALFAQTASDFEVALTKDNKGAVIKKYTGNVTNTIKIPSVIDGLPVREIEAEAFSYLGRGDLSSAYVIKTTGSPFTVILPSGLTKIGERAFRESALTSVVIPDSVTYIGDEAFSMCSYFSKTGSFSRSDFYETYAFTLVSVTLPKGLVTVGKSAFSGNPALKTVVIPNGVPVISEDMFNSCTALSEITIPDSVRSIGAGAFSYTGLTSIPLFSKKITSIGPKLFYGCAELKTITIPEWVTEIGAEAFGGCLALISVTIHESVENIELAGAESASGRTLMDWAFNDSKKLNLATQARLKTLKVTSAYEIKKAQEQREKEERIAKEKREQEELQAKEQAEYEAKLAAQQKREEERYAQAKREQEAVEKMIEKLDALSERLDPMRILGIRSGKINKQQFTEFMSIYEEYAGIVKQQYYDYVIKNYDVALWVADYTREIVRLLDKNQKKTFDAKFGGS